MYNEQARQYLSAGLNPVPLNKGEKVPNIEGWTEPIGEDLDRYRFEEIGICTGAVSGGLEVIDLDLDVLDNADEVWEEWKSKIPKNILRKMTVAQTKSGGYHVMYRTSVVEGNKKLASKADKTVIMETRGQGGYIKTFPSDGYEIIYGSLDDIKFIEEYERNVLITTSKLYDERIKAKKSFYGDGEYSDPFPKFNEDPDIGLDILEEHGWEVLREDSEWIYLKRPGKRREGVSATYNLEANFLYVFSTSTDFETEKPYSNSAIHAILEHEGNFKKSYRELRRKGYGVNSDTPASPRSDDNSSEDIDDLSFISMDGEDEERLMQAIEGEVPVGLSFGWPDLDPYYVYKENTVNFILAFEGVGKTWMMLHKLVALSVLYGKKFALCCGENEVSNTKQILIEAFSGKKIDYFKGKDKELRSYKDFINAHFFIFKNEVHYTIEDVLERATRLKKEFKINGVFIDPFSYFKRPLTNQYAYSDDLLSRLNIFAKKEMTVFMSIHPNTDATRAPRDPEGYLEAPSHYSATGGNMFANRTDHFLVYHRIVNHRVPKLRRIMEIRSCKVKDSLTGGSVTPVNETTSLTYKTVDGFTGYFDTNNRNPIYDSQTKKVRQIEKKPLPKMSPGDGIFD